MPKTSIWYNVLPTFSPGSSAQVERELAERVAKQEREHYGNCVSGIYGEDVKRAAERRGLGGIVFNWNEHGKHVEVRDMITDERHDFAKFTDFQNWNAVRRAVTQEFKNVLHRPTKKSAKTHYAVEVDNETYLVLRDLGPWDRHPTITNDAENVVVDLLPRLGGRRILYIDSTGSVDELLVKDGKFSGFAPGSGIDFMRPLGARP